MWRRGALGGFVLLFSAMVMAAAPAAGGLEGAGYWTGSIEIPDGTLEFHLDLVHTQEGGWSGRVDLPSQAIRGLGVIELSVKAGVVSFGLPGIPGNPTFSGSVSAESGRLEGRMTQGGGSLPFSATRATRPEVDAEAVYRDYLVDGAPGSGAAGVWRGLIVLGPARLRVVAHVTRADDGSLVASLDSPDQNATGLQVDTVRFAEQSLNFELKEIGASYEGRMTDDGATVIGAWTQGGQALPLTFKRAR